MNFFQVCHSFSPNSESDIFCHPRFGMIRCIATTRAVRAGQEITINYGCEPFFKKVNFRHILFVIVAQLCTPKPLSWTFCYSYNLSIAPTWYKVAWAKHQKVVRGLPDWR